MRQVIQLGQHRVARAPFRRRVVRRRFAGLGLEPDSYFVSLVADSQFQKNMGKKYWPKTQAHIEQAVRSGLLPPYTMERCASVKPVDKKTLITSFVSQTLSTVGGAAVTAGAAGAAAAGSAAAAGGAAAGGGAAASGGAMAALAAAGPFILAGAVVFGVISAIFSHHAKAVALEQTTLCGAIPGANESLAWIDSEFKAGRISKADAAAALDELLRNFDKYVQPILKDTGNGKVCNYACGTRRALTAIVAKKKQEYAEAPDSILTAIVGGGDLGSLLPWAAAAAAAFMVMR